MIGIEEVRDAVRAFDPRDDARAARSRALTLALIGTGDRPWFRGSFEPGHLTASGLVLSRDGTSVLLVLHDRLRRWLQPGGHIEPGDASAAAAACREVLEETGVVVDGDVAPRLVGVDVHEIPAARGEPAHRHHDLVFRFVAPAGPLVPGAGTLRAEWVSVERLGDFGVDEPLRRAVMRALPLTRGDWGPTCGPTRHCPPDGPPRGSATR